MSGSDTSVVIGLDGGGSKTLLAVADRDGAVTTLLRGAGVNPFDAPDWRSVLGELRTTLGLLASSVAHGTFGLPGYGEAEAVSAEQDAAAAAFGFPAWSVLNDVEAAFEGAFVGRPGVLLLAGTGSMVWARSAGGRDVRIGGWGEAFGDEGSAFWIGRELLGRASRALDGRLAGEEGRAMRALAGLLIRHLGREGREPQDALLGWYAAQVHPRSAVAALATFVDARAETGDQAACTLLDAATDHLARHVEAAWQAMANRDQAAASAPVPWSYAGGAFRSRHLLDGVAKRLGARPVRPILPPVGGALLRAAHKAGWDTGEGWIARLSASLAERLDPAEASRESAARGGGDGPGPSRALEADADL